jgi:hypothetical protein
MRYEVEIVAEYSGTIEADTPEEAADRALDLGPGAVMLCTDVRVASVVAA